MTIKKFLFIILVISFLVEVKAIWPPSYKINLSHEETFVISEELSSDDTEDVYEMEDEMIKERELKRFNLENDSGKYSRLHQLTLRRNSENAKSHPAVYNTKTVKKPREVNYEKQEEQPWESGFVNKNGNLKLHGKNVYHPNQSKNGDNKLQKNYERRKASNISNSKDVNYDYGSLKADYDSNIKSAKVSNDTLNFTETKDEETFKDAVHVIVGDTNKPQNCTVEERKGIGLGAAKCFWSELRKPGIRQKERSAIFHRIATIILIWISVYLLVAIPCWCQRGWCCCCFQCKFCKPRERIDVAKKYLLDNPAGVYHDPNNQKLTYTPTNYEKYAQNKLEKALIKL